MRKRHARAIALATLAYLVITIVYAWPLPARLMHGVAHDPGKAGLRGARQARPLGRVPARSARCHYVVIRPQLNLGGRQPYGVD